MPPSPLPPSPAPIPDAPPAKIAAPNIAGLIGAFIVVLGMGWGQFASQNPDDAAAIQGAAGVNLAQIAGVLVMIGGFVQHSMNAKANAKESQAKITAAALSPPVDAAGNSHSTVTLAAGCEQLINEGRHDVAVKVIEALKGVQA